MIFPQNLGNSSRPANKTYGKKSGSTKRGPGKGVASDSLSPEITAEGVTSAKLGLRKTWSGVSLIFPDKQ